MALFGSKNKKIASAETTEVKETKTVKSAKAAKPATKAITVAGVASPSSNISSATSVILRPRITEKSGVLSQTGVYTFEVTDSANKNSIAQAIKYMYKVVPTKIAIVNLPDRKVFVRGRRGVTPGARKALVTLKKGDKIDFV